MTEPQLASGPQVLCLPDHAAGSGAIAQAGRRPTCPAGSPTTASTEAALLIFLANPHLTSCVRPLPDARPAIAPTCAKRWAQQLRHCIQSPMGTKQLSFPLRADTEGHSGHAARAEAARPAPAQGPHT